MCWVEARCFTTVEILIGSITLHYLKKVHQLQGCPRFVKVKTVFSHISGNKNLFRCI